MAPTHFSPTECLIGRNIAQPPALSPLLSLLLESCTWWNSVPPARIIKTDLSITGRSQSARLGHAEARRSWPSFIVIWADKWKVVSSLGGGHSRAHRRVKAGPSWSGWVLTHTVLKKWDSPSCSYELSRRFIPLFPGGKQVLTLIFCSLLDTADMI